MFKKKSIVPKVEYHPESQKAVIKCSICNGEQVAGFKNRTTGEFTEVMLIRNKEDLELFQKTYEIQSITKEY